MNYPAHLCLLVSILSQVIACYFIAQLDKVAFVDWSCLLFCVGSLGLCGFFILNYEDEDNQYPFVSQSVEELFNDTTGRLLMRWATLSLPIASICLVLFCAFSIQPAVYWIHQVLWCITVVASGCFFTAVAASIGHWLIQEENREDPPEESGILVYERGSGNSMGELRRIEQESDLNESPKLK